MSSISVANHNAKDANRRPFCVGWGAWCAERSSAHLRCSGIRIAFIQNFVGAFIERPRANDVRPYGQAEPSVDAQPKILSPQIPDLQLTFGRKYAIINT